MGGVVSKVFGRGYRTNEQGSTNVPADADGASPPEAQQAGSDAALLATADAPLAAKQQSKPDASVPLAADLAVQEEGVIGGTKAQEAASPMKAGSDASVLTGDGAKPPGQSLSKKPSVLGTAKEDVLGVLESVRKNVGAAKEAFFERPSKHEQPKPPSSPTKTTAPVDEKRAEQAEPCKTPEAKTGGFFAKLGFSKPDEQQPKEKAKEEGVPKSPEEGKKESGSVLHQLTKQASVPTEVSVQPPKSDAQKDVAKTLSPVVTAADAITCQEGLAAGALQAAKKASEEALDVVKTKAQEGLDSGSKKAEYLISAGKASIEDLKQKTQDAAEATKSKVAAAGGQARQATDAALNKAGELKENALKAADAGAEKAGSLAQQAQQSATAAVDYLGKKGNEAVQFGTAQATALAQQVQGTVSAGKSQAEEVKESAVKAGEDTAAAAAERAEVVKKAAEEAVASGAAHVASAAENAKQTLGSEAEKVNLALQQAKPAVFEASAGAKQAAQEMTDAVKSGAVSLKVQLEQASNVASSEVPNSAPADASAEVAMETTQEADHHKPQEEPARPSSPVKQQSFDGVLATGKAKLESFGQQVKGLLSEEPNKAEVRELDVEAPKKLTALNDNAVKASNAVALKSSTDIEEGTNELSFQSVKEKSHDTAEMTKLCSQEAFDSAKSEAELLVERVISSVVGASESLQQSSNEATAESEKYRLALLREKAQQEFASCQEKAQQLFTDVSSAVSEGASTVAAKSAEVYGAAKSKAHSVSEQVAAVASDTTESLKHGVQTLQEQAANKAKEFPGLLEPPGTPLEATKTSGTCASEVPQDQQCREESTKAQFTANDQLEEHGGDRLSPIPKLDDIESAVVKIQAGVRGYLTRKNLQFRTPQDDESSKTTGNAGGQMELSAGSSEPLETEAAATKIQAAFRGYMVRKELKPDNGPGALHKEERELVESR